MSGNPVDPNFFGRAQPDNLDLPAFMQASLEAYRTRQQAEQRPMADVQISPYSNPAVDLAALQQRLQSRGPIQDMGQSMQAQQGAAPLSTPLGQPPARSAADYKTMLEITKETAFNDALSKGNWGAAARIDPVKAEKLQTINQNQEKHDLDIRLKQFQLENEPVKTALEQQLKLTELQKNKPEYKASQDRLTAIYSEADAATQGLAELDRIQPILESGVLSGFMGTGGLTPGIRSTLASSNTFGGLVGDVNTRQAWSALTAYETNLVLKKARFLAPVTETDVALLAKADVSRNNSNEQNIALAAYDRLKLTRTVNKRDFVEQYVQIPGVSSDPIKAEKSASAAYQKFINARPAIVSNRDWKLNIMSLKDASTPEYNDTTAYLNELRLNGGNYKDIQLATPQKTRIQEYKAAQAIGQQDAERAAIIRSRFPNLGRKE